MLDSFRCPQQIGAAEVVITHRFFLTKRSFSILLYLFQGLQEILIDLCPFQECPPLPYNRKSAGAKYEVGKTFCRQ